MDDARSLDRRLYQQVADRIRALVQDGEFVPGSRLPSERELAQQLGVSRPSLREALIALEIEGMVEVRMGSGIYVVATAPSRPAVASESPVDLMQARMAVEGVVVLLAAMRLTEDVVQTLRRTTEAMRRDIEAGRDPLEHDRRFHVTIAEQVENNVLTRIVSDLFDGRHSPIFSRVRSRFESETTWPAALVEHEAILRALEDRNAVLAQSMMHAHLEQSKRRWLENDPN